MSQMDWRGGERKSRIKALINITERLRYIKIIGLKK